MVESMSFFATRRVVSFSVCAVISVVVLYLLQTYELAFQNRQGLSGWLLVSMVCILLAYNLRKKLSFLPLGNSANWLQLHIYIGLFTLIIFISHIGGKIAEGFFAMMLTLMFLAVCLIGLIGIWLSRVLSKRLSRYGEQLIFERIPGFAQKIRQDAEEVILESVDETLSSTLAESYSSILFKHFSSPPRSFLYLFHSERYIFDLHNELDAQERFLSAEERKYADQIRSLAVQRHQLDSQYAIQSILKGWLFLHIPLSYSVVLMIIVHVVLVYAFGAAL